MKIMVYILMIIIFLNAVVMVIMEINDNKNNIQLKEENTFLCKENDSLRMEIDSRDHILIENNLWDYYK
jgi:hypothetical protein